MTVSLLLLTSLTKISTIFRHEPASDEGDEDVQALRNHLENVQRNDAKQQQQQHHQSQSMDIDDEKVREIGKSNLDKWLQLLLFKDVESTCSSPGRDTPHAQIVAPGLSHISVAAMRESLERASHQVSLNPITSTRTTIAPVCAPMGILL